jgi:hypothetical protein
MGLTEGRNGYGSSHQCDEKYGQGGGGHDHGRLHHVRILARVISIPLMSEACDRQSLTRLSISISPAGHLALFFLALSRHTKMNELRRSERSRQPKKIFQQTVIPRKPCEVKNPEENAPKSPEMRPLIGPVPSITKELVG